MKKDICIICGGKSPEHEVSLVSSELIYKNISKKKYKVHVLGISKESGMFRYYGFNSYKTDASYNSSLLDYNYKEVYFNIGAKDPLMVKDDNGTFSSIHIDVFFPIVHGVNCEDGTLQGLLSLLDIPYVGCKTLASSMCMDKETAKKICAYENIPLVQSLNVNKSTKHDYSSLKFPVFVKPSASGSSFGISKVYNLNDLYKAIDLAFKYSKAVLIEEAIEGREIECAVLGTWDLDVRASKLGEVIPNKDFYSYEAKYIDSNGANLVLSVSLDNNIAEKIKEYSIAIFKALKCDGLARVDFFLENNTNKIYFNEINTIPGFTSISMYPSLWNKSGLDNRNLVSKLVNLAFY
jgi:D-alanine-D-alanine ligase